MGNDQARRRQQQTRETTTKGRTETRMSKPRKSDLADQISQINFKRELRNLDALRNAKSHLFLSSRLKVDLRDLICEI